MSHVMNTLKNVFFFFRNNLIARCAFILKHFWPLEKFITAPKCRQTFTRLLVPRNAFKLAHMNRGNLRLIKLKSADILGGVFILLLGALFLRRVSTSSVVVSI
jgi:hypothetical protein